DGIAIVGFGGSEVARVERDVSEAFGDTCTRRLVAGRESQRFVQRALRLRVLLERGQRLALSGEGAREESTIRRRHPGTAQHGDSLLEDRARFGILALEELDLAKPRRLAHTTRARLPGHTVRGI